MSEKEKYMRRALELARLGEGYVSPNPMVGCVIVKDGQIISEGYHERYGGNHAERNALLSCTDDAEGADLYVTLEPCCHHGKTPPCTDIILEKKIGRVFVGCTDPNPKVAGKGIQILKDHGLVVETGLLEEECLKLNEVFFHYISSGRPFVVMKYAMSLDGKIACSTGDSKWITGKDAREHVHALRKRYSSILVGINTVINDNPMLDCRIESGVNPVRIICDSSLRIPLDSRIMKTANDISTIIACSESALEQPDLIEKADSLRALGAEVLPCGKHSVDLPLLFDLLGEKKIDSVLVEGGGTIHGSLRDQHLIDKVYAYIGGTLIGGKTAPGPVKGIGASYMDESISLENMTITEFKNDFLIAGTPVYRSSKGGT